ncbi:hypothetical protein [Xanthomonas arboricola]
MPAVDGATWTPAQSTCRLSPAVCFLDKCFHAAPEQSVFTGTTPMCR